MAGLVQADNFSNNAGTGAPTFSNGANLVGGALSGTFTGNPAFGGIPVFSGGFTAPLNVNSADANKTLVKGTDPNYQVFTGFTAARTVTLPTTGVVAGEIWYLANSALFDMVVAASNGSALTIANSAPIDSTVRAGYVALMAVIATPTTPANWLVLDIKDTVVLDSLSNQWATGTNVRFFRDLRQVGITSNGGASGGVPFTSALALAATASGYIPLRFRPSSVQSGTTGGIRFSLINNGSGNNPLGDTDMTVQNNGTITWSSSATRSNTQQDFAVNYLVVA